MLQRLVTGRRGYRCVVPPVPPRRALRADDVEIQRAAAS